MLKFLILMGSPRLKGNTAELLKPFIETLHDNEVDVTYITLADKHVEPCRACYACQEVDGEYGCPQDDDMQSIAAEIIACDCLVLATPIFSWYCSAQMKAVLDRHYGLNKFYGRAEGSLWAGKTCAIVATHGYDAKYATEPFETGVRRLCEHSKLRYLGMYSMRDEDNIASFQTAAATSGVRAFALQLIAAAK